MQRRLLVMGASGLIGQRVVAQLCSAGHDVYGASRFPQNDREVRLDLLDPSTFRPALRGMSSVMLMSRPGDEDAHVYASGLVDAMVEARVERVVVLSAFGAERRPASSLRRVEQLVESSGLAWTHVRPNFFMQMLALPPLATEIATRQTLSLPLGDAAVAYVDAADVAAVLCKALTDDSLTGRAIRVSGPEGLSHEFVASTISAEIGRPIRYVSLAPLEARLLMKERGFPLHQVERVLDFYALIRQGFCSEPDGEVAALLGRPLRRWTEAMPSLLAAWQPL